MTGPTVNYYRFRLRRAAAARWSSTNDVLLDGEFGLESDTGHIKVGDGSTTWNNLRYWSASTPIRDLACAPTVSIDAFGCNAFRLILTENAALGAPTNLRDGQRLSFLIAQDSAAGHRLGYDSIFRFPNGASSDVNEALLGVAQFDGIYDASAGLIFCRAPVFSTKNIPPGDVHKYEWSTDGSFTLDAAQTVTLILVGGGGGGSSYGGGGGGGGGVVVLTRSLVAATYAVTVGAGGAGGKAATGGSGGDSSIDAFVKATGGGGGLAGGGGAAGGDSGAGYVDGAVVNPAHQGLDYNPGGGAGAGMDSPSNGHGGDGMDVSTIATYFGGGGGSGSGYPGGLGGGGAGIYSGTPTAGTDGLGGGGGGQWSTGAGGAAGGRGTAIVLAVSALASHTGTVSDSIITLS